MHKLPETDLAPENRPPGRGDSCLKPPYFKGKLLVFREGNTYFQKTCETYMIYNIQVSRIMIPKMKDPVTQMHWAQQVIRYETCCSGRVQQKSPSCFHCNNLGGDCHPGWGIDPTYDHLKRHVKWTFEVLSCSDWCSTPPLVAHLLRENGHLKSS